CGQHALTIGRVYPDTQLKGRSAEYFDFAPAELLFKGWVGRDEATAAHFRNHDGVGRAAENLCELFLAVVPGGFGSTALAIFNEGTEQVALSFNRQLAQQQEALQQAAIVAAQGDLAFEYRGGFRSQLAYQ